MKNKINIKNKYLFIIRERIIFWMIILKRIYLIFPINSYLNKLTTIIYLTP